MIDAVTGRKVRVTRKLLEEALQTQHLGGRASEIVYCDDLKESTKHCCSNGSVGIKVLPLNRWVFSDEDGDIEVPYYACYSCFKVIIYRDLL